MEVLTRGSGYGYSRCFAPYCTNTSKNSSKLSFFRFPKDIERCKSWIKNANIEYVLKDRPFDPRYYYHNCRLCSAHFENRMFAGLSKNRLKRSAVPTVFILDDPSKMYQLSQQNGLDSLSKCNYFVHIDEGIVVSALSECHYGAGDASTCSSSTDTDASSNKRNPAELDRENVDFQRSDEVRKVLSDLEDTKKFDKLEIIQCLKELNSEIKNLRKENCELRFELSEVKEKLVIQEHNWVNEQVCNICKETIERQNTFENNVVYIKERESSDEES